MNKSQRWVKITESEQDTAYIYSDSIKTTKEGTIMFWGKLVPNNDKQISHSLLYMEIDCKGKRSRVPGVTIYFTDGTMQTGKEPEWEFIIPDTRGEFMYKFICQL